MHIAARRCTSTVRPIWRSRRRRSSADAGADARDASDLARRGAPPSRADRLPRATDGAAARRRDAQARHPVDRRANAPVERSLLHFPTLTVLYLLGRMRRPDLADKLSAFEVFPDRELWWATRSWPAWWAALRSAPRERRLRQALRPALRQGDGQDAVVPGDDAGRVVRLRRAHRAVAVRAGERRRRAAPACRASPARRRASCRCSSARSRPSTRASTNFRRRDTAQEYFRWRQEEANVPPSIATARTCCRQSGADRQRGAAHPRRARARREGRALAPERARLRHRPDLAASRRRRAHPADRRRNGHARLGRLIVDLNLPNEDGFADYLRQALPRSAATVKLCPAR